MASPSRAPFVAGFAAALVGDRDRMYAHLERGFLTHDPALSTHVLAGSLN